MGHSGKVILHEFEEIRASTVGMGPADLQALDAYSRSLHRDGIFHLRPDAIRARHYVGVVVFADWQIEIRPKILQPGGGNTDAMLQNLLWMLARTDDMWCCVFENASLRSGRGSILDIVIRHFATTVLAALRQGIPQLYVDRVENLGRPRGRIDFKMNLRENAWNEARLTCRFSEITYEHILMRAIRFVLKTFQGLARSQVTRQVLSEALARTCEVPDVLVTFLEIRSVPIPRGNPSFTRAVEFAKLVLQGHRTEITSGNKHGMAIVFDMNRLFERYIVGVIQRNRETLGIAVVVPQKHARLVHTIWDLEQGGASDGHLSSYTDIVIKMKSGGYVVLDTKYKVLGTGVGDGAKHLARTPDVYQILAYQWLHAHPSLGTEGALIYPQTGGSVFLRCEVSGGKRFFVKTVSLQRDLQRDEAGLVKEIAALLRGMVTKSKQTDKANREMPATDR